MDERTVPAHEGRAEVRERASRFLAFVSPASTPEEAGALLAQLKKEYHDATHVAFAWKIGSGASTRERASDAGEPSGTAGKPIAAAIASAGVTDVVAAVVRYFGGTKLGTGGLSALTAGPPGDRGRGDDSSRDDARDRQVLLRAARLRPQAPAPSRCPLAAETFEPDPVLRLEVLQSRLPGLLADIDKARLPYEIVLPARPGD
jgi:hypothetical protein